MRGYRSNLPAQFSALLLAIFAWGALVAAPSHANGNDLVTLKSLDATTGSAPYGSVVRYTDGTLWGTCSSGVVSADTNYTKGTVFTYNPTTPAFTVDEGFSKPKSSPFDVDGSDPFAPLILGSDGNFYGVTEFGGANNLGVVFQVTPDGTYSVIYSFKGTTDGADPYGGLVEGPGGVLYGTTLFTTSSEGSPSGSGTIFKITTSGTITLTQLFVFPTTGVDGQYPQSSLTLASDGNLYGVARLGGAGNYGVLFRVSTAGTNFDPIHTFLGGADGGGPDCTLLQASNGVLYGTTNSSDLPPTPEGLTANYGTIFSVTTAGKFTSLASFDEVGSDGTNVDGAYPSGSLVQLSNGYIYGTVENGGPTADGGVFVFNPSAAVNTTTNPGLVYNFTGTTDSAEPVGGLTLGQDGNIYGTATGGFSGAGDGSIFEVVGKPSITSLSPSPITEGSGGTSGVTLTINGANFNPNGPVVTDNGNALTPTLVTTTKLEVTIPAAYLTTPGTYNITVSNDPNIPSATAALTVAAAMPTITSVAPATTLAGAPGFTLVINGTGFVTSGESVTFGGTSVSVLAFPIPTSTQLYVGIPASALVSPGPVSVVVNDNNGAAASNAETFTILASTGLLITGLNPASTPEGSPTFTLTIHGTGFSGSGDSVTFAGTALTIPTGDDSATSIQATVPATLVANAGIAQVVESNGFGGDVSNSFTFNITPVAPTLTSLSPTSVTAGSAGFSLTISGSNFNTNGVTVKFGSDVLSVTSITTTKVIATVPAADIATAGSVSVTVNNDNTAGPSGPLTFTVDAVVPPTPLHTFDAGLQMISVPDDFTGLLPSSLLGTSVTLLGWNQAKFTYISGTPPLYFGLGEGFWVKLGAEGNLFTKQSQADTSVPYAVTLAAGWNLIGDPFTVTAPIANMTFQVGAGSPVSFADATTSGFTTGQLYTWGTTNTTAYTVCTPTGTNTLLEPYAGYWIFVKSACTLIVSATPAT